MPEIKVIFSDGSTVTFHEEQTFQTKIFNGNKLVDGEQFGLWRNENRLMVPSFLTIVKHSDFFYDVENPEEIFESSTVVSCEEV